MKKIVSTNCGAWTGIIVTVIQLLDQFCVSMYNPVFRLGIWVMVVVLLMFESWKHSKYKNVTSPIQSSSGPIVNRTLSATRFIWYAALAFVLCCFFADMYRVRQGYHDLAHVLLPVDFDFEKRSLAESQVADGVTIDDDELIQLWTVEDADGNEHIVDGLDFAWPLGDLTYSMQRELKQDDVRCLYTNVLKESFAFDIRKDRNVNRVIIEDVVITVHRFYELPPTPSPDAEVEYNSIIVVPIKKLDFDPPWRFSARFFLGDYKNKTVDDWSRVTVSLTNNHLKRYLVKVLATYPGIYEYSVSLILKSDFGHRRTVDLVTENSPRKCYFQRLEDLSGGDQYQEMSADEITDQ